MCHKTKYLFAAVGLCCLNVVNLIELNFFPPLNFHLTVRLLTVRFGNHYPKNTCKEAKGNKTNIYIFYILKVAYKLISCCLASTCLYMNVEIAFIAFN